MKQITKGSDIVALPERLTLAEIKNITTPIDVRRPRTLQEMIAIAAVIVQCDWFRDLKQLAQAVVKIMIGCEIGVSPAAAVTGVYIVKGRVMIGSHLMATAIKSSGRYTYRVVEHTDERCVIRFMEREQLPGGGWGAWQDIGEEVFTAADAARQGTGADYYDEEKREVQPGNMKKFPRNMNFARCLSNGARFHAPDALHGPMYTPEDFGIPEIDGAYQIPPDLELPLDARQAPIVEMPKRASETGARTVEIVSKTPDADDYAPGSSITLRVGTDLYNLKGEHAGYWLAAHGGENPIKCTGPGCERCEWRAETKTCTKDATHAAFVGPWCPECMKKPPEATR